MRIDKYIHKDRIEFYLYGEKTSDYIAKLEIYHWRVTKELGIDITELLRVAFGR
ncbi:MAG: hypothetical protein N2380_04015 [bacterium]|nr:hypothetical protein [bacterium]